MVVPALGVAVGLARSKVKWLTEEKTKKHIPMKARNLEELKHRNYANNQAPPSTRHVRRPK